MSMDASCFCTYHVFVRITFVCFTLLVVACRLYAYEGVGMLLGQEELAAEEQHAYIAALLQPLIQQVCPVLKIGTSHFLLLRRR